MRDNLEYVGVRGRENRREGDESKKEGSRSRRGVRRGDEVAAKGGAIIYGTAGWWWRPCHA